MNERIILIVLLLSSFANAGNINFSEKKQNIIDSRINDDMRKILNKTVISYKDALSGIILQYDQSGIKYPNFTIKVKENSFLFYKNEKKSSFGNQKNVQIFIKKKNGQFRKWDGAMLYKNSEIQVYIVNSKKLNDLIFLKKEGYKR